LAKQLSISEVIFDIIMTDKTLHIVTNEFTRNISHPDEWWLHRLSIYEHFCLASLRNQTNKNFVILMTVEHVPVKFQEKIKEILSKSGLTYIFRVAETTTLAESLKEYANDYDIVYSTRIDSDDMLHKDAIAEIQTHAFAMRQALLFQKGYCYDCRNNKLRHYFMPSPPFSTIMYPMAIYLDEEKQQEYRNFKSHDRLVHSMPYIILSENKFIVNVHGTNRITTFENNPMLPTKYKFDRDIDTSQILGILKDFNISNNTYSNIKTI